MENMESSKGKEINKYNQALLFYVLRFIVHFIIMKFSLIAPDFLRLVRRGQHIEEIDVMVIGV